jgi:hypothetical protein
VKHSHMEALYIERSNIFSRYCLYNLAEIIALSKWDSDRQIRSNILLLFEEMEEVTVIEGKIFSLTVDKEAISIEESALFEE